MKHTPSQIKQWNVQFSNDGITWKPARSINYLNESWRSRIKNAWGVLIGRYDALDWDDKK